MIYILFSIIALSGIAVLAAILPIRLKANVSGGTDEGFRYDLRVLAFNGIFGGGFRSTGGGYRITVYLRSRCLLSFDISRTVKFMYGKIITGKEKPKEKKEEKKPTAKKKRPVKFYYRLAQVSIGVLRWCFREFSGFIGFDKLSTHITLGLWRPDITGYISGLLIGLNGILPDRYEIVPSWDFTNRILQGDVDIKISVRGYIFWKKLFTSVPIELYRQRKHIQYWLRAIRGKQSFQEV